MPLQKVSTKNSRFVFYDIESLSNAFTVVLYDSTTHMIYLFYTLDLDFELPDVETIVTTFTKSAMEMIPRWADEVGTDDFNELRKLVYVHDLKQLDNVLKLATMLGTNDRLPQTTAETYINTACPNIAPVNDYDPDFDPMVHPYLCGYNSYNYDDVMLSLFLYESLSFLLIGQEPYPPAPDPNYNSLAPRPEVFANHTVQGRYVPVSAKTMREHNDNLFSDEHRTFMRRYLYANPNYGGWLNPAHAIFVNMCDSGRHIDVAELNESQKRVALKRLLGYLGIQIIESSKLSSPDSKVESFADVIDLLVYNFSDTIGLAYLFSQDNYQSNFDMRAELIYTYPETVFNELGNTYKPDDRADNIRRTVDRNNMLSGRSTPSSTTAQITSQILAPYSKLEDLQFVDFTYPRDTKAMVDKGLKPFNVLDKCREFFYANCEDPNARANFDEIYNAYKTIEGKNVNDSKAYQNLYEPTLPLFDLSANPAIQNLISKNQSRTTPPYNSFETPQNSGQFNIIPPINPSPTTPGSVDKYSKFHQELLATNMVPANELNSLSDYVQELKTYYETLSAIQPQNPATLYASTNACPILYYYNKDGSRSDYFTKMSLGGTHGCQYNRALYDYDLKAPERFTALKHAFIDGCGANDLPENEQANKIRSFKSNGKRLGVEITDPLTGEKRIGKWSEVLTSDSQAGKAKFATPPKEPSLFTDAKYSLKKRYAYTSVGWVWHDDYKSYYPNMLIWLTAFANENLPFDRYLKSYEDKESIGAKLKQAGIDEETVNHLSNLRAAVKLLLNAASGAAAQKSNTTSLPLGNYILSMRIIGQWFSWMVAQAVVWYGGGVPATNTDGLHVSNINAENNQLVLDEVGRLVQVDIEPEPMLLVSKDSNNRLELMGDSLDDMKIVGASGPSLSCWKGPSLTKSSTKPAIYAYVLAKYLKQIALNVGFGLEGKTIFEPMDKDIVIEYLKDYIRTEDKTKVLIMFQNIVRASTGQSPSIPFCVLPDPQTNEPKELVVEDGAKSALIDDFEDFFHPLSHYSRMFMVKPNTTIKDTMFLRCAKIRSRPKKNQPKPADRLAKYVLATNHIYTVEAKAENNRGRFFDPNDYEIIVGKVEGVPLDQPMVIHQDDLHYMKDSVKDELIAAFDLDAYADNIIKIYKNSWQTIPVPTNANVSVN